MLKRKKNKPDKPAAERRRSGAVGRFVLGGSIFAVLVLAAAGAALFLLQQAQEQSASEARARLLAQEKAERVREAIAFYFDSAARMAGSPYVAGLLESGSPEALTAEERRLKGVLPGLQRVHLIPADRGDGVLRDQHGFGFAALEMRRIAAAGGKPPRAEVHAFNSKERHATLAAPVMAAGEKRPVGVIMMEISLNPLLRIVRESELGAETFELIQVSDGQSVKFAGNAGAVHSGSVPVAGTIWQVAYAVTPADGWQTLINVGAALAAAGLLIALALYLVGGGLRRGLDADRESLVSLFRSVLNGKSVKRETARVPELQPAFDWIADAGRPKHPATLRTAAAERPNPAVKDQPQTAPGGVEAPAPQGAEDSSPVVETVSMSPALFRPYDIGGVFGEAFITDHVYEIGRAIGSEAGARGQQTVIVGRDGRDSSPDIKSALCWGLEASGRDVVDIGMVPTPVLYFATQFLGANSGVMITGSHSPPNCNGLKIVIAGESLADDGIQALRTRVEKGDFSEGAGIVQEQNLVPDYIEGVVADIQMARNIKVVIDCGNGVAGRVAPEVLRSLGCDVSLLYCDINGAFPNHLPDPGDPENLQPLIAEVARQQAELGIAFDGDGDSFAVVTASGQTVWPDQLLMLFARDVLSRQPGTDVIYDVESSRHLAREILLHGGRPVMWKSGHSRIGRKMAESGALLAGEMGGHFFFKDRWMGFDDALYASARLLEILSMDPLPPEQVFAALPQALVTPELKVALDPGRSASLMNRLSQDLAFEGAKIIDVDGVRAEFEDGWGLVRPSATAEALVFRFEADDADAMGRIQKLFKEEFNRIIPGVPLPF